MKTSFTCLAILIAALTLGRHQNERIATLEQRISSVRAARRSNASSRIQMDAEVAYRTMYECKSAHAKAEDVFQSLLGFRAARKSVFAGAMDATAMENRDALQAVMQLNLSGLDELIQLIAHSKDPAFGRDELVRCEQIVLCLTAVAEADPARALDYVCHSKEQIGAFFEDRMSAEPLVKYLLIRLSDRDPQGALNALLRITSETPAMMSYESGSFRDLLGVIALQYPGPVLDAIQKLPGEKRTAVLEALGDHLESDHERTALFLALRDRCASQPAVMEEVLSSLCARFNQNGRSMGELRQWVESLGMTDAEKLLAFRGLSTISFNGLPSEMEASAKWYASFLPESNARKVLAWAAATAWMQSDRAAATAFLREQGIDPDVRPQFERRGE